MEQEFKDSVSKKQIFNPTSSKLRWTRRWWFWLIMLAVVLIIIGYVKDYYDNHKGENLSEYISKVVDPDKEKKIKDVVATFTPESKAAFQYNTPTVVDDYIYIGTSTRIAPDKSTAEVLAAIPDNYFYKLDLDLKPIWTYELCKTNVAGGAVLDSNGNIYFVTEEYLNGEVSEENSKTSLNTKYFLRSLNNSGKLRWEKPISQNEHWIHGMVNPAIGQNGTIYIGLNKFYAFDSDGNQSWQYPVDSKTIKNLRSAPIIDQLGDIYFMSPEPTMEDVETENIRAYKFSPAGKLLWSTVLDNQIMDPEGGSGGGGGKERWILSAPSFSTGDKSIYAIVGNTINKVDTVSGKILWSLKPEGATGSFKANPVVDGDDNIYVGTKSNQESMLYAISASGSIIWKKLIGGDIYPSPFLGDDGKLYVGSEPGINSEIFHLIDLKTGEQVFSIDDKGNYPGYSFNSPTLYKGYVYNGCSEIKQDDSGKITVPAMAKLKVKAQNYLSTSPWPRFHGGNANNGRSE